MDKEKEAAILLEYDAGKPVLEIAARHHVSTETLCKLVRRCNIPMRGQGAKPKYPVIYPVLAERMKMDGLRFKDVAELAGYRSETVAYALTGRKGLTKKLAVSVAKALGYEHYIDLFGDVFNEAQIRRRT